MTGGNKRKVQVRKERKDGFTEAKRQIFLDHLAGCANITPCGAGGGDLHRDRELDRRRDPAFAGQVEEAIEAGYAALEAMALDWAAHGGRYRPGDTEVPGPEGIDPEVALHLLRLRRAPVGRRTGRAGYEPKRASEKELNEAILAKLDVLARRRGVRKAKARAPGRRTAANSVPLSPWGEGLSAL